MALKGNTVQEQIWNYLKSKGLSNHGAAGLMGNLYAESKLNPKNLENLCEKRLKEAGKLYCTDEAYTAAVDSGQISREEFLHPLPGKQYGYGMAQWTSSGRKAGLYNLAKSRGVSIGDLEMQMDFLMEELNTSYKSVLAKLKSARSVKAASDVVLIDFESPSDQGDAVKKVRAGYGQKYYDEFAASASGGVVAGTSNKPEGGKVTMTESQARQQILSIMQGWVGLDRKDGSHKVIIDTYNGHKPLARNYTVKYTDAYCATTISAAAIQAGFEDIIPLECGCGQMVQLAQKMGIWQENDAYQPEPGDIIMYDWQDSGAGDYTGWPDHVGMAEKVVGNTATIIEGNINGAVGRRNIRINGRYIRGYILPKYEKKADKPNKPNTSGSLKVGDIVNFTGSKQYSSSYSGGTKKSAKPCQARVTAIRKGKPHPYHLVALSGGKVYGWCDAGDIEGASGSSGNSSFKIGDSVSFTGNKHYTSSYAGATGKPAQPCKAKVIAMNKNGKYPYHVVGDTVHGWVKASDISR